MLEEKDFPVIIPMQKSTRAPAYHFGSSSTKYTTMPKELMSLASGKPEDEQKDLMDRKRQYPTLCKVLSSVSLACTAVLLYKPQSWLTMLVGTRMCQSRQRSTLSQNLYARHLPSRRPFSPSGPL